MSACTSNGALNTDKLEVEQDEINTIFKPVEKQIAEEAIPFDMEYPTYLPFEYEETKVSISSWDNSNKKVVTTIKYPSIEEDVKWEKDSMAQPTIPHVEYTVANFDRYYSRYSIMNDYKEVEIKEGVLGYLKLVEMMNGVELHWFNDGKEYNLFLLYFSEDKKEIKNEIIKIANSI